MSRRYHFEGPSLADQVWHLARPAFYAALLAGMLFWVTGCDKAQIPGAPTAIALPGIHEPKPTSQVLSWPHGTWLEHDPSRSDVQVCITRLRMYCAGDDVDETCEWELDYYTVALPKRCPAQPIE